MSETVLERIARSLADGVGAVPKYKQLYDQILLMIESSSWKPGERLPGEAELAKQVPVSLGTVQKALKLLVDDGILVRRHGDGTYVASRAVNSAEIRNFHFVDDAGRVLPLYPTVLSIDRISQAGAWRDFLRSGDDFIRIRRLMSMNGEFLYYGEFYLPDTDRFRRLLEYEPRELDGVALAHLLGTEFNAPALRIAQRIRFATVPDHAAPLMEVEPGSSVLLWSNRAVTYRELPLFFQHFYVPPNDKNIELSA